MRLVGINWYGQGPKAIVSYVHPLPVPKTKTTTNCLGLALGIEVRYLYQQRTYATSTHRTAWLANTLEPTAHIFEGFIHPVAARIENSRRPVKSQFIAFF